MAKKGGFVVKKVRHQWNLSEFDRIRNSPGVQAVLRNDAGRVVHFAGRSGYAYHVVPGQKRAHAYIRAVTPEAQEENQKVNTLIKALNGGR